MAEDTICTSLMFVHILDTFILPRGITIKVFWTIPNHCAVHSIPFTATQGGVLTSDTSSANYRLSKKLFRNRMHKCWLCFFILSLITNYMIAFFRLLGIQITASQTSLLICLYIYIYNDNTWKPLFLPNL